MSPSSEPRTFLCICSYLKGQAFLSASKGEGNVVILLTADNLKDADWPWDSVDDVFYMPIDKSGKWQQQDLVSGLADLMRSRKIDRIVALDDFDVEKATFLREHFRIPGMGQTTGRYFRDKLSMRIRAQEANIPAPAYSALFNDQEITRYTESVPPPWVVKPRSAASAIGITKVQSAEELWPLIARLGDERHNYLMERFAPGDVYHVDCLYAAARPFLPEFPGT